MTNVYCDLYVAQKLYEEASQVANDAVGNIRTIAAFCAEEKVMNLYQKKCLGPIKTGIWQGIVSGTSFGLSLFLVFSVNSCSFYAGARRVENGKTSISDVFRVILSYPCHHFRFTSFLFISNCR